MKKYFVCLLLLCAAFPLCAQSKSAAVYVPPVTGIGSKPEDNEYFHKQLVSEVTYQHFNLAKTKKDAEFTLIATLSAHPDNASYDVQQYVLHLAIVDNKNNKRMSDGELVYEIPEDIKDLFPGLVYTLLYTIPQDSGKDNWRNKWLFAGAGTFWTPRIYTSESVSTHLASFGGGIFAEYHFLNFMSVETGFEIATDMIKVVAKAKESYNNALLEIPVLVKGVIKPGDYFILEPYAGVQFNIPFDKTTAPPALAWLAGFQYGVKAGPGVLFIDPRFSMDMGESVMDADPSVKDLAFQRYIIHVGVGYKLGFFTKR
jgi:hypothetical protein